MNRTSCLRLLVCNLLLVVTSADGYGSSSATFAQRTFSETVGEPHPLPPVLAPDQLLQQPVSSSENILFQAIVLGLQAKRTGQEDLGIQALHLAQQSLGKDHPALLPLLQNLPDSPQAPDVNVRALAIAQEKQIALRSNTVDLLIRQAETEIRVGQYQPGLALYQQAWEKLSQAMLPAESLRRLAVIVKIAQIQEHMQLWPEAAVSLNSAVPLFENFYGKEHPLLIGVWQRLGKCQQNAHQPALAEAAIKQEISLREKIFGLEHESTILAIGSLARHYARIDQMTGALQTFRQASGLWRQLMTKQPDKAETWINHLLELANTALGSVHPVTGTTILQAASHYLDNDRPNQARPLFQQAFEVFQNQENLDLAKIDLALTGLTNSLIQTGKLKDAEEQQRRLLKILAQSNQTPTPMQTNALILHTQIIKLLSKTPFILAEGIVPLTREIQNRLSALHLLNGPQDGKMGPKTKKAIQTYQLAIGLPIRDEITAASLTILLDHLPPVQP